MGDVIHPTENSESTAVNLRTIERVDTVRLLEEQL